LYFLRVWGLSLLPLGLAGILVVVLYTPWLARNAFACLVAPGLGFGTIMVVGTHFALTGEYSRTALAASFVPFFLVSNLLLLNQFPDVDADRTVGRKNYPIVIGRRKSAVIYGAFLLLTFVSIVVAVILGYLPKASLIGLAALGVAVPAAVGAYRFADDVKRLAPYMGLNVVANIATPLLVAVGLLVA
jgi:1,4-dihydroxy-2-naphthoate octaprenyltransferase